MSPRLTVMDDTGGGDGVVVIDGKTANLQEDWVNGDSYDGNSKIYNRFRSSSGSERWWVCVANDCPGEEVTPTGDACTHGTMKHLQREVGSEASDNAVPDRECNTI